jgi:hypothetical protein
VSNDLSRRSDHVKADRDRILEQALKAALRAEDLPRTPQCLDAETLAAWEDGGLDAAAVEDAEVHVSTCARCQSMVGALDKGTPATVPVAESKNLFSWHWWFAPLAAGAAAMTLWMVVPEEQQQLAMAPPSVVAPARDGDVPQQAKEADTASQRAAENAVPAAKAQDALEDRVAALPAAGARADRRERAAAPAENKEETGKLLAEQPAAMAAAADAAAPARPAATEPFAPPAAPAVGSVQKNARASVTPVEIISNDGLRRWRAVPTGIEYSTDRGVTWVPVRAIGTETITGGVAVSGSICWLIGKAGAVLVTVDGMTFAKVDLPVRADVASISATDARSAVATTVDGRTFRTDDSGRNWHQN